MPAPIPTPVRYDPSLDPIESDEMEIAEALSETFDSIQRTTFEDEGRPLRGVHAKAHGILKGKMEVPEGLPPSLAQGVFARPGEFEVLMRFSTSPGDLMSDRVSTPRGIAIKILDVEGARLEGSEGATTQDFLFANGPAFSAPSARAFLANLKMLAATTDKAEGVKRGLSAVLRTAEAALEAMGGKSSTLVALGGQPPTHILGDTFFSQLPQRFGDFIAKFQVSPFSENLKALEGQKVDLGESDTILRDEVVKFFADNAAVWELKVQLCTDLDDTPIDKPSKAWDDAVSPFFAIARITASSQVAWNEMKAHVLDGALGFSPWNGIEAHRPLGSLMRIRKHVYARAQAFRSQHIRVAINEPNPDGDSTRV
jgi:hypothetical protein